MPKTIKVILISLLLVVSLGLSFSAGCRLGSASPSDSELGLDVVEEAWQIIFKEYVEQDKLDASKLSEAAIKGMVEALDDPYTSYLNAQTYQLSRGDLKGKFEGIGAYVGIRDKQLMVISPIPDSPADRSGIRAGDIILAVEGTPTAEMSLEEAVLRIRGPEGTAVKLLILHQGEAEPDEIEIIRAEIKVPSVTFEMKEDIAYIRIYNFSERTDGELSLILEDIAEKEAAGIILDLRSNPGGLLETVVDVASHFLREGIVLSVLDNQGKQTSLAVEPGSITTDLPLVALSDNFSASGSEVLIGALQDHGRATIAGVTTFGKGSVNTLNRLKDGSGLYITIARWLTPNGRLIEGEGIAPDFVLELEGDAAIQWAIDYLKDNRERVGSRR
ncbi:MAG: S41 family peptidase [Chloroflexi bacterium]|nr:S41 family peptidase [Chloroflexota bacterium]